MSPGEESSDDLVVLSMNANDSYPAYVTSAGWLGMLPFGTHFRTSH